MLAPTRKDRIDDKLLAIEGLAKIARARLHSSESKLVRVVLEMVMASKELDLYIKTSEDKGRKMGWWK